MKINSILRLVSLVLVLALLICFQQFTSTMGLLWVYCLYSMPVIVTLAIGYQLEQRPLNVIARCLEDGRPELFEAALYWLVAPTILNSIVCGFKDGWGAFGHYLWYGFNELVAMIVLPAAFYAVAAIITVIIGSIRFRKKVEILESV